MPDALPTVLFVDLQEGFLGLVRTQTEAQVRGGAGALAAIAAAMDLPVVASGIDAGLPQAPPLLREIAGALPGAAMHVRRGFDALADAATRAALGEPAGRELLVAGVATEAAVYATARSAAQAGFRVRLVLDACAGLSERTEAAALRRIEADGMISTSVPSLVTELVSRAAPPAVMAMMQAIRAMLSDRLPKAD